MAVPFPYPPDNLTGFVPLMQYGNTLLDNYLGIGILILIGSLIFLASQKRSNASIQSSFSLTIFILLIIAFPFRFIGLISDFILYGIIILLVLVLIWVKFSKEGYTQV